MRKVYLSLFCLLFSIHSCIQYKGSVCYSTSISESIENGTYLHTFRLSSTEINVDNTRYIINECFCEKKWVYQNNILNKIKIFKPEKYQLILRIEIDSFKNVSTIEDRLLFSNMMKDKITILNANNKDIKIYRDSYQLGDNQTIHFNLNEIKDTLKFFIFKKEMILEEISKDISEYNYDELILYRVKN